MNDSEKKKASETDRKRTPGALKLEACGLTLHTKQGSAMYYGRKAISSQPPIVGLQQFNRALGQVDDQRQLRQIEAVLIRAENSLTQIKRQIDQAFSRNRLMVAHEIESKAPLEIKLELWSSEGFRGAQLLTVYDTTAAKAVALFKLGVYGSGELDEVVKQSGRLIRRAYLSPMYTRREIVDATSGSQSEQDAISDQKPVAPDDTRNDQADTAAAED